MLHSVCQEIWKTQQWPQDCSFQSQRKAMPKNIQTTGRLHSSHMLAKSCSSLQGRLQQYLNRELADVQAVFRKDRGARDQIATICWIMVKSSEFQRNVYFLDYAKAFDCMDHTKLWKILKDMEIPDHLTCLLRNLYTGQEAALRTEHGTMASFPNWERICQGCILSPCLFNLHAGCKMLGWMKHSWNQGCLKKYQEPQIGRW